MTRPERLNGCLSLASAINDAKVCWTVEHNTLKVKGCVPGTVSSIADFPEVFFSSRLDVFEQDGDMRVSVWPGVLVHSA